MSKPSEEQLDLNPQPLENELADEVGRRLRNNQCPRCIGDLARITEHGSERRYCMQCRMTVIDIDGRQAKLNS
jgi:ribosomal protein S27AE